MSVYVDDFNMVGRKENLADMWIALREDLDLEPETELSHNVYLGCNHREDPIQPTMINENDEPVHRLTTHEAEREAQKQGHSNAKNQFRTLTSSTMEMIKAWNYDMTGHAKQRVQIWCELTQRQVSELQQVATPALEDHFLPPEDSVEPGKLAPISARIILKCLHLARIGRPDLLFAVNVLARKVRAWTRACGKKT